MKMLPQTLLFRVLFPLTLTLLVVVFAAQFYIPSKIEAFAIEEAQKTAANLVDQYKALRGYYTNNVIKKVLAGSTLKPSFDHANNPQAIPLPATMIHDLSNLTKDSGIRLNLYSKFPFPNRKDRQLNVFQSNAWDQLVKHPGSNVSEVEENTEGTFVRVAIADTMSADACIACHNSHPQSPKTDWKLGDVRGVLEVTVPITGMVAQGHELAKTLMLALIGMSLLMVLALFLLFRNSVRTPLAHIADKLADISSGQGDLSQRISYDREDEISPIVTQFNRFIEQLRGIVSNINHQGVQLHSATDRLSHSIDNTVNTIRNQHNETDQTAAAIEEMSNTVAIVETNAEQGLAQTQMTDTLANEGIRAMQDNQNAIKRLAQEIEKASTVISQLHKDSDEIGSVIDVIRSIADQTNLLALNAAIEAARAGEQGRGFAVVADEVRSLASKTQSSTEEIQSMIRRIQQGTQEAVNVMQSGSAQAESSVTLSESAAQVLNRMKSAIEGIREYNHNSSEAAAEQRQATDQIHRSIHSISMLSGENADSAEVMAENITALRNIVTSIEKEMRQFKL